MIGGLQHLHLQITNIVYICFSLVHHILDLCLCSRNIPASRTAVHELAMPDSDMQVSGARWREKRRPNISIALV